MVGSVLSKFPGLLVVYFVIWLFAPTEQLTPFLVIAQVPDEVYPTYDHGAFFPAGNFKSSFLPVERPLVIDDLREVLGFFRNACLNRANLPHDHINDVFFYDGPQEMPLNNSWARYLPGTTYWFNEDLHVGHVHYDIVLLQALRVAKIDRIVLQRSVCKSHLCSGIGTVDSFYKAYFASIFEAAGQPGIPVYLRWTHTEKSVKPLIFSTTTSDLYNHSAVKNQLSSDLQSIQLERLMCFDTVMRSGRRHQYGALPSVGVTAVQDFKKVAYSMASCPPTFLSGPPFHILLSHRGPSTSRHISNLDQFVGLLRLAFPAPAFNLSVLNNSIPNLDWRTQLRAVANAHVVITNHGAFQGNLIYMRNSSLLIEMFGTYGNNEVHTFHRLSLMFGVFYSRVNCKNLTSHRAQSYIMTPEDTDKVVSIAQSYFSRHPKYSSLPA